MSASLDLTFRGRAAIIELRRADVHNALDGDTVIALHHALQQAMQHARARVIILRAAGPTFCAGADLRGMADASPINSARSVAEAQELAETLALLREGPKPTIARVQGNAFGGGVGLIAACDMSFSVPNCAFALTETRLGLIPAVISPYVLARLGPSHTRRLFLSGERINAAQACAMGLLHDISADETALDARIEETIDHLARGGPQALAQCKQLLATLTPIPSEIRATLCQWIADCRQSAEGQEGMRAFLEKRAPSWLTSERD